jgi:hypothetical protein
MLEVDKEPLYLRTKEVNIYGQNEIISGEVNVKIDKVMLVFVFIFCGCSGLSDSTIQPGQLSPSAMFLVEVTPKSGKLRSVEIKLDSRFESDENLISTITIIRPLSQRGVKYTSSGTEKKVSAFFPRSGLEREISHHVSNTSGIPYGVLELVKQLNIVLGMLPHVDEPKDAYIIRDVRGMRVKIAFVPL